jgi:hypothetical protein
MSGLGVERPNVYMVVSARCPKCGVERVTCRKADPMEGLLIRAPVRLKRLSPCCQVDEERTVRGRSVPRVR